MFKNRFILFTTIASLIFIQVMLWSLFWQRNNLPPQAPFNYWAPWGQARLAPSSYLWYLPALGALFLMIDLILARFFYKLEKLIAQLLTLTAAIFNFLLTLSLLRILSLIFRWV